MENPTAPEILPFDTFVVADPIPAAPTQDPPVEPVAPEPTEPLAPVRTPWSNLLYSYREVDKSIPETLEIPDDLDAEKFKTLLYDGVKAKILETEAPQLETMKTQEYNKLVEKGLTAEQIERGTFISSLQAEGADDDVLEEYAYLDTLAKVQVEDEVNEIELLRRYYQIRNQDPEMVETHLGKEFVGEDKAEKRKSAVKKAQTDIAGIRDQRIQAERARVEQTKNANKLDREREQNVLKQTIDAGFYGIKLSKDESEKLKKAMFEVDSHVDIQTPKGLQRIPQTAESKAWAAIMKDPVERVAAAYIAINGIGKLITVLSTQKTDNFIKAIEQSNQAPGSNPAIPPAPDSVTQTKRPGVVVAI